MKESQLWHFIEKQLEKSNKVILLIVVESHGSSPGRQGFKMAVAEDGFSGSIGGGIMEHKFVELAKEMLHNSSPEPLLRKQVHSKSAKINQSGMICSGEQTIVLYQMNKSHCAVVKSMLNSLEKNGIGLFKIFPNEIFFSESTEINLVFHFEMKSENDWKYEEQIGFKNHLYIIGGGHCSLALSQLMSNMNFYIHVIEDRSELNTLHQNSFAHNKKVIPGYDKLSEWIPDGDNVYVVIMTFGYRTDDIALRALINRNYKYLGILGSESKMKTMFEEWRKDKLPEDRLRKIFAPIGLNINSQSPEEIAVSIAAEIISIKNRGAIS